MHYDKPFYSPVQNMWLVLVGFGEKLMVYFYWYKFSSFPNRIIFGTWKRHHKLFILLEIFLSYIVKNEFTDIVSYYSLNLYWYTCDEPVIHPETQQAKDCDRETRTVAGKSVW